jgi:hypothetical protein
LEALKVVARPAPTGVKVALVALVVAVAVVARRGVTEGAMVTRGRADERRVDAWDWARALSGILSCVSCVRRADLGRLRGLFKLETLAFLHRLERPATSQQEWTVGRL